MQEEWRPVPGCVGLYEVSSFGSLRSIDRTIIDKLGRPRLQKGRVIKQQTTKWGYRVGWVSVECQETLLKIHRVVAQAFIPNDASLPQVNHKDGDKTNNCVGNLEWCDATHNVQHAIRTGLKRFHRGEKIWIAKVTEDDVRAIRRFRAAGRKLRDLAGQFGLSQSATWAIIQRKSWAHVQEA